MMVFAGSMNQRASRPRKDWIETARLGSTSMVFWLPRIIDFTKKSNSDSYRFQTERGLIRESQHNQRRRFPDPVPDYRERRHILRVSSKLSDRLEAYSALFLKRFIQ